MSYNVVAQFENEKMYSKQNIRDWMLKEFAKVVDAEFQYQVRELFEMVGKERAIELLIVVLRTEYQSIQSVVSQLAGQFDGDSIFEKVDAATEMVVKVAKSIDIYSIIMKESLNVLGEPHTVVYVQANYSLGEALLQRISDTLFIPPMICEPRKLYTNRDSAYLTLEGHVILKGVNQHDGYQALDALNIINAIPMSIDPRMLTEIEEPKNELDTAEKKDNFNRMCKTSKHITDMLMLSGNVFYLDHKYGKRGRMYENSYHVGIQKNTFRKGMMRLANAEVIPLD